MLTFQDCVSFSGLTEDIVAAIARQQSVPDVVACGLGSWLLTTAQGVAVIRHLLEAGIGAAGRPAPSPGGFQRGLSAPSNA